MTTIEELTKNFTDKAFDKAEEMQKEMHILTETMLKSERGKNMSYDDVHKVFILYKIAQVNEFMDNFSAAFNFDHGIRNKDHEI